jgi:toxin ParE1/3/4
LTGFRKLRISDPARLDPVRIGQHTERQWGAAQKRKYLSRIKEVFRSLRDSPGIGTARDAVSSDLRSHRIRSHIIFYREKGTVVEIVRILHERMDPERHLKGHTAR